MVSVVIKEELRIINERVRMTIIILIFWVVVTTLDFSGVISLFSEGIRFVTYAIMAATSVILLVLGLGIQIEPFVKEMIKRRKDINSFWERDEILKPNIEKRAKISEIIQLLAILLMMISLLFIMV
ncbi:MAG: hypothetical protein KAS63_03670 [Candidatus Heimdallarchaeota archaeon]|nr:hypothetical protein [Candidatus Heimdallarchaeota archaeon]MCK4954432.1 hypothetical protein [Candidatus Heimdallarchaeota archaeon]